jgi:CDP-diacylglycerol---glycerol-3-phosphate 3-phosphatidyltransferase
MRFNVPNILTLFRIGLVPVMVVAYYLPYKYTNVVAAALFAAGAITDWLDGWIARRYGLTSSFGEFLDPVADKLSVTVALFLIVQTDPTALMAIVGAIIVGREIAISALREWMAEVGQRKKVRVVAIGKIKTIAQMVAIIILFYRHDFVGLPMYRLGQGLLMLAAALTLWSGFMYVRAAWPHIQAHDDARGEGSGKGSGEV